VRASVGRQDGFRGEVSSLGGWLSLTPSVWRPVRGNTPMRLRTQRRMRDNSLNQFGDLERRNGGINDASCTESPGASRRGFRCCGCFDPTDHCCLESIRVARRIAHEDCVFEVDFGDIRVVIHSTIFPQEPVRNCGEGRGFHGETSGGAARLETFSQGNTPEGIGARTPTATFPWALA